MKRLDVGAAAAVFHRIETDFGLVIDELEIQLGQCGIVTEPLSIQLDQPGEATAIVNADSVRRLLEKRSPDNLRDFSVEVADGLVHVSCKASVLVQIPVKVTASLEIVGGRQIFVRIQHVDVLGGPAKNLVESQILKLNPIFDVSDFPFPMDLRSVVCSDGKVVLSGLVRLPT